MPHRCSLIIVAVALVPTATPPLSAQQSAAVEVGIGWLRPGRALEVVRGPAPLGRDSMAFFTSAPLVSATALLRTPLPALSLMLGGSSSIGSRTALRAGSGDERRLGDGSLSTVAAGVEIEPAWRWVKPRVHMAYGIRRYAFGANELGTRYPEEFGRARYVPAWQYGLGLAAAPRRWELGSTVTWFRSPARPPRAASEMVSGLLRQRDVAVMLSVRRQIR